MRQVILYPLDVWNSNSRDSTSR